MRSRQIAERLGVEEAHMLEFQQFNALWDKRMAEFEQKSADLEEAMKERHGTELMEYRPSHPQPETLREDRHLHPKSETRNPRQGRSGTSRISWSIVLYTHNPSPGALNPDP